MKVIRQNVNQILSELPEGVQLVAAAKTRQPEEILGAVEAGVKIVGENFGEEGRGAYQIVARTQKNSVIPDLIRDLRDVWTSITEIPDQVRDDALRTG